MKLSGLFDKIISAINKIDVIKIKKSNLFRSLLGEIMINIETKNKNTNPIWDRIR